MATASMALSVNQPGQVTDLMVAAGAGVVTGQPILAFAIAPSARSSYQQAKTQVRVAREQLATTERLLSQQLATHDQVVQARKGVSDAEGALSALAKEGAGASSQTIRAPFDGVVTNISVAQGDRVQAGATLAAVAKAQGIVVRVGVPPARAPQVQVGAPARLHPFDAAASYEGRVSRVDRAVDPQTRLVDVDIEFLPSGTILSGAGASAEIEVGTASGWLVPHEAVITADSEPHVFQVVGDKAHAVAIKVIEPGGATDVVQGPIDPARPLIVEGAYQVEDGGTVRIQAPAR
jgi:RND family efflux transporter MFP subunit